MGNPEYKKGKKMTCSYNILHFISLKRRPCFLYIVCFTIAGCCWVVNAGAQNLYGSYAGDVETLSRSNPDTIRQPANKFCRSSATLLLSELTPWAVDHYIRHVDYANISMKTIGDNVNPKSWSWDGDGFTTNQFGHPYHGSYFFNSFRANGYNFWQSAAASFAGSYIWETVAENQAPAPNDFINTGFGGSILGEMTHRIANKIINNRATGLKRQVSEIAAFLINPVNGFTRLTDGRWGRLLPNAANRDTSSVLTEFDLGVRKLISKNEKESSGLYAHIRLIYGSAFENYKSPFSHIFINAEFGKDDSSKLNILSVYGSIAGWQSRGMQKKSQVLLLTANYDYIRNSAFFYSAQSLKCNFYTSLLKTKRVKIKSIAGAGWIVLAAVPDRYGHEERFYDYCTGANVNGFVNTDVLGRFLFNTSFRGSWLKSVDGTNSTYVLAALTGEVGVRIFGRFFICGEAGYATLRGSYKEFDPVNKKYAYLRLSLRYNLF